MPEGLPCEGLVLVKGWRSSGLGRAIFSSEMCAHREYRRPPQCLILVGPYPAEIALSSNDARSQATSQLLRAAWRLERLCRWLR